MKNCPEDISRIAKQLERDAICNPCVPLAEVFARALLAERKRCADYLLSCGDHGDAAKADSIMRGEP